MNNLWKMQTERGALMQDHPNGEMHHCFLCGRKLGKGHAIVEIDIDGYEFGTTDQIHSQGGFRLGSECAKKFPTAKVATQ